MLKLEGINKKLGRFSLSDININIPEGEYFVLLGRSGSGKSQLLELIAGLNIPDSGSIWLNNEDITFKKIQERQVGLVFQDYALFPNMTVSGNISYSLLSRGTDRKTTKRMVAKIAEDLNISTILSRSVTNLSGGELQRVALARTLVTDPKLLLLDEPMASIDASLKDDVRNTLRLLHRKGLTVVHVTHDYREAVSLATMAGVIHNGHIIQTGRPEEVFSRPVNKFVARYAGIRNFFRVKFSGEDGSWTALCKKDTVIRISGRDFPAEGLVILKGDEIKIHESVPLHPDDNCIKGIVREINPSEYGMEITVEAGETFYVDVTRSEFRSMELKELSETWITFCSDSVKYLPGVS